MKKLFSILCSFFIIISLNILLSSLFNTLFIEMSFLTGLLAFVFIAFFSSEGGFTTSLSDLEIKRFLEKESRTNTHFFKLYSNTPLIVSIIYTVISAIINICIYYPYFI